MGFDGFNPLVDVYITMERSTVFNGKTHVISTGPCSIAMSNYQRLRISRYSNIRCYYFNISGYKLEYFTNLNYGHLGMIPLTNHHLLGWGQRIYFFLMPSYAQWRHPKFGPLFRQRLSPARGFEKTHRGYEPTKPMGCHTWGYH